MGEVIVVTSLKGGVGKTVFSASLAYDLARRGKKVLAVDMDLDTGGLDIALGKENAVLPSMLDLLRSSEALEEILSGEAGVIQFLSAPVFFNESGFDSVSQERFDHVLTQLKKHYDFCIFDMPAGGGPAFPFLENSGIVDLTAIVTTCAPTAVRAAERCAMRLKNPEKIKLVLNCYRIHQPRDNVFQITEVLQRASVSIIGVIPYDTMTEKSLLRGIPLTGAKKSVAGHAIENISRRISGDTVPLFDGVLPRRKRKKFY